MLQRCSCSSTDGFAGCNGCRKLGGQPDGSWLAGAAATAAGNSNQQQQQLYSPREAADFVSATAKAAAAAAACDDTRLLRPVDPAKPGYYWKPVQGDAAAAAAGQAVLHGSDNILGFQVCVSYMRHGRTRLQARARACRKRCLKQQLC